MKKKKSGKVYEYASRLLRLTKTGKVSTRGKVWIRQREFIAPGKTFIKTSDKLERQGYSVKEHPYGKNRIRIVASKGARKPKKIIRRRDGSYWDPLG